MHLRVGIVIVVAACAVACNGTREPTAPSAPEVSPDYAVYDAALDALFGQRSVPGTIPRYVIKDSTVGAAAPENREASSVSESLFGPLLAPIVADTKSSFVARSAERVPLDASSFHPQGRVDVVSERLLETLTDTGPRIPTVFWRAFYARFPGANGLISFSRPGYDASGTHALLYYGHGCGGLCGDWGFILLERRGGKWTMLRRVITAMS